MKKVLPVIFIWLLLFTPLTPVFAQVQRNVSVSAVIPPTAASYQFSFASDGQTSVPQRAILEYTITYGVEDNMDLDLPITIVADFNDDLSPDNSHVVAYVPGSASNAYGGAPPVVDLLNRKITWTIPHLPEGTQDQTITFQLKTTENYSGFTPVNFTTKVNMSNQYVTMPEESVTQTYSFDPALVTPTPTPTPGPTATPGPRATATPGGSGPAQPTPTPSPRPQQSPLVPSDVSFPNISPDSATVTITTREPVRAIITYGTDPNNLNQTVQTTGYSTKNTLTLKNLKPNTTYYFRITLIDRYGNRRTSEIFTFKTAKASRAPSLDKSIFVLGNNGGILISNVYDQNGQAVALGIMAPGTPLEVRIKLAKPLPIKSMVAIISPKALGANTYTRTDPGPTQITVPLQEIEPGTYTARMTAPRTVGNYDLSIQVTDASGNIVQNKMADLRIIPLLTVVDAQSKMPIVGARVLGSIYNPKLRTYQVMQDSATPGLHNPSFTNHEGTVDLQLPLGRYEVTVSSWGRRTVTTQFVLGSKDGQNYPRIELASDPFNVTSYVTFVRDWFSDIGKTIYATTSSLAYSPQLLTIVAALITGGFIAITFLLFSIRTQIKFSHLFRFLFFTLAVWRKRHKEEYLMGSVASLDQKRLASVSIDILDPKTRAILTHTQSTATGSFHLRNNFQTDTILLLVTKDGFVPEELPVDTSRQGPLTITLQNHRNASPVIIHEAKHMAGSLFEVGLLFSLVLELIFFVTFGALATLPFLLLSLVNIILWVFYLEEHQRI